MGDTGTPPDASGQILHWNSGCQDLDRVSRLGLASNLFELILDLLTWLGQSSPQGSTSTTAQREAERLLLWGDDVSASDGQLDDVLSRTAHLRQAVLTSIYGLGLALHDEYKRRVSTKRGISTSAADLESLLEKTAAVLERTAADTELTSLSESSTDGGGDYLKESSVYIDCLTDLSFAIKNPVLDAEPVDSVPTVIEVFDVSGPAAAAFCRRIRDRFNKLPKWLVERLGEANARRSEALKLLREASDGASAPIAPSLTAKVPGPAEELPAPSETLFSNSLPKQTNTTLSTFQPDSVFDMPARQAPRDSTKGKKKASSDDAFSMASFTSFSTTFSEIASRCARVPPLPDEAYGEDPFPCFACKRMLAAPLSRSDWKKHLFQEDLLPFVCTVQKCLSPDDHCASTRAWVKHEKHHREGERYECPFCDKVFVLASVSDVAFYKHIAGHLREVSLAVLPQGSYSSDNERESDTSADNLSSPSDDAHDFEDGPVDHHKSKPIMLPEKLREAMDGYIPFYWEFFHPKYPILHRPSFGGAHDDALLCVMAAIGTQYMGSDEDSNRGIQLHKAAWAELQSCPPRRPWSTPAMQAIFLCEYFACFRGQEVSTKRSGLFINLYATVRAEQPAPKVLTALERRVLLHFETAEPRSEADRPWKRWVELEARRRLVAACFLLDVHASALRQQAPCYDFDPLQRGATPIGLTNATAGLWEAMGSAEFAVKSEVHASKTNQGIWSLHDLQHLGLLTEQDVAVYPSFDRACFLAAHAVRLRKQSTSSARGSDSTARADILRIFPSDPVAHTYLALDYIPLADLMAVGRWSWSRDLDLPWVDLPGGPRERLGRWVIDELYRSGSVRGGKLLEHAGLVLTAFLSRTPAATFMPDLSEYWAVFVCTLTFWAAQQLHWGHMTKTREEGMHAIATEVSFLLKEVASRGAAALRDGEINPGNRVLASVIGVILRRLEAESNGGLCQSISYILEPLRNLERVVVSSEFWYQTLEAISGSGMPQTPFFLTEASLFLKEGG